MKPRAAPGGAPEEEVRVTRVAGTRASAATDFVVVEEPLEVRLGQRSLLVTMRTPGDDLDLVRGLLFTEGLVARADDVAAVAHCDDVPPDARGNVVIVSLRAGAVLDEERTARAGIVTASCGVCGKATLAAIRSVCPPVERGPRLTPALLAGLPPALRGRQRLFDRTGGIHAAGLFAADGTLLSLKEDVGRHNAVDKVVGEALRFRRLPLRDTILVVSGRAGFEIAQKAWRAGVPVLCSVSAPSSLAVALAQEGGLTLVGFLRDGRFNVYAGEERFDPPLA